LFLLLLGREESRPYLSFVVIPLPQTAPSYLELPVFTNHFVVIHQEGDAYLSAITMKLIKVV
jgi:hypothetical protein